MAALAVVVARGVVGGTNDKVLVRRDGEVGNGGCFLVVDACDTLELFGAGVTFTIAPPPPSPRSPPFVICPSSIRTSAIPTCLLLSLWDPPSLLSV